MITSLGGGQVSPKRSMELVRGHGSVENGLHFITVAGETKLALGAAGDTPIRHAGGPGAPEDRLSARPCPITWPRGFSRSSNASEP